MADKKDKTSEKPNPFTFNADKTGQVDVPSVSKLINRKKFNDSKDIQDKPASSQKMEMQNPASQSFPALNAVLETDSNTQVFSSKDISIQLDAPETNAPSEPAVATPVESEPQGIVLESYDSSQGPSNSGSTSSSIELEIAAPIELNTFSTSSADTERPHAEPRAPGVISKPRRVFTEPPPLSIWKKKALLTAKDPVAGFLKNTLANDLINGALFLAIEISETDRTPVFRAKAALEDCETWLGIWTGLEWNPKLIPEVWNVFVKNGFVEFSPPGTTTNLTSSRNVIRGAFGLGRTGYLTLVRVGSAQACRGVLALVSDNSIQMAIDPFMSIAKS